MKTYYKYVYHYIEDGWQLEHEKFKTLKETKSAIDQWIEESVSIEGKKRKNYRIIKITEEIIK